MEAILNFVIQEIFGQGAIFLALIACIGLILQKKSFSEIVRGTIMTPGDRIDHGGHRSRIRH